MRRPRPKPSDGTCPECGAPVLVVFIGGPVLAEPREVVPPYPCPDCQVVKARGQRRSGPCTRCGGDGRLGEPLPEVGVALNEDDRARLYRKHPRGGTRTRGESIHPLHDCPASVYNGVVPDLRRTA